MTAAFDAHNPPSQELIADCVHCGFCLPACPTYQLWGEEMDSPRGRIHLMQAGLEGAPMTDQMVEHFDACLGCMSCVTACPSGVQYDRLLEQTRAQVERHHERSRAEKALRTTIFSLFPYPARLRKLRGPLRATQRLGLDRALRRTRLLDRLLPGLAAMERLTPKLGPTEKLPDELPAVGDERAVVGMLTGCVQDVFFSDVNAATARVLAAEGCRVVIPSGQGCCGALSSHSGREPEAQRFAKDTMTTFGAAPDVQTVVANAAGCGSAMKDYGSLFSGENDDNTTQSAESFATKVRDLSEVLAELGTVATRHPLPLRVAYHDACHLGHAQGVRSQPRKLLREIPGLEIVEIPDAAICCGSAGVYNILHPETAAELGESKARNILATAPDLIVTANPGCLMQIANALERLGSPIPMAHTATVLDASIRGLSVDELIRP
ncbi:glycolate oxidase iron-sulfur subunit [Flexivirga endophytica]|uniref:Glycolate oxidase iron-sulfur subunit n=1 Tax=Flexivirga endophytica TaxID=1849103 RepID=A0A916TDI9_9MICO|nr:heterodisulfide reductase-related iron-sulfur binding cluster [Flexivirga endophytica]GGB40885.1 glycolate oxidase iron-sulfur subunit [Flexivirga endophytica]GHB48671.1 glycolate oxidase iron-sulfur subunit [Flexivirga endophytica]